jgi:hypothetical protein
MPTVTAELDPDKFEEFKTILTQIYYDKYANEHPVNSRFGCFLDRPVSAVDEPKPSSESNSDSILYYITFSMSNEIILNDMLVIAKPNLNSENGEVFHYLFEHPNKMITKKELEQSIGQSIGKDFHKIVENLGFTGDLRKTFFQVSNNALLFRNPITKADFDQLGIPPLRISKR